MELSLPCRPDSHDQAKDVRRSFLKKSRAVSSNLATVGTAALPRFSNTVEPLARQFSKPWTDLIDSAAFAPFSAI